MMALTEPQRAELDRLANAAQISEWQAGQLHAYLRSTRDPNERKRIEDTLARHEQARTS